MSAPRLLLIGWDAADWKVINALIEKDQMPALSRVLEEGVMADMQTLEPVLSPMLWTSIATGQHADRHGILGFSEMDARSGRVRPVMSTSRKVKALWNILTQNGYRTHVINWFASHPAEPVSGVCVSDAYARGFPPAGRPFPLLPGTVHPVGLAETIANLRVRPEEIDQELICLFVPRAAEVDQEKDHHLEILARIQAECFSVHAAATWVLEQEAWDFLAVYYPSIDHFSHAFMNYHPPKPEWVAPHEFELYQDVIASAYRFHDLMLARLLYLAGPDTTVLLVSDHGFHSDHLRPRHIPAIPAGPAAQHRPLGIFAMKGPGIRRDERIYGINLLDVAPTALAVFGLPAGADMPGRVLAEAFEEIPALDRLPSWEAVPGPAGMHPPGTEAAAGDAELLLRQFIALGYIEEPRDNLEEDRRSCLREQKWNLARVYMSSGRWIEALALLEEIHQELPERGDFALAVADCQWSLGLLEEAAATAAAAIREHRDTPIARLVLANIAFERGRYQESLEHLEDAVQAEPHLPEIHVRLGLAFLKLRRWKSARQSFRRALALDPHHPHACQGMALACLRLHRDRAAARWALTAVGFRHDLPPAHFYLGIALTRLGEIPRAIQAFETTLTFQPPLRAAHRWLARLYLQVPGSSEKIRQHIEQARDFARQREQSVTQREESRRGAHRRTEVLVQARAAQSAPPTGAPRDSAPEEPSVLRFTVVSGLPRSGTSLMMRMLAAAGVPVMTDGKRPPDEDNLGGYFEWEEIKKLPQHPEILRQAEGKAMKIVSVLLAALPRRHHYKVIFMDRPIQEVVASHRRMIANRGEQTPPVDAGRMARILEDHRAAVLANLRRSPSLDLLVVDYPDLVRRPDFWVACIADFLGPGSLPRPEAMAAVIRPEWHRQRGGN